MFLAFEEPGARSQGSDEGVVDARHVRALGLARDIQQRFPGTDSTVQCPQGSPEVILGGALKYFQSSLERARPFRKYQTTGV